jgi:hypothetical protein
MLIDEKFYPALRHNMLARHTASHRYDCKRFKFTDETSSAMGKMFGEMPEVLLRNYQFALPPYPNIYTEFDLNLFLEALKAPRTSDHTNDPTKLSGYLNVNGMVTVLSGNEGHPPMPSFHCYCIDAPPHPPTPRPPKCNKLLFKEDYGLAIVALGSTFHSPALTQEMIVDLNSRLSIWMENWVKAPHVKVLQEFVGDIRNFWALMLWLNQPSHLVYDIVPKRRELTKKGPVVYQEHTLVRLRPGQIYHHLAKNYFKRASPGGHDVREFFRNFNKTDCVHDWPLYPDEEGKWQCQKCPQYKVRVAPHRRGDESRPVKRRGYQV